MSYENIMFNMLSSAKSTSALKQDKRRMYHAFCWYFFQGKGMSLCAVDCLTFWHDSIDRAVGTERKS